MSYTNFREVPPDKWADKRELAKKWKEFFVEILKNAMNTKKKVKCCVCGRTMETIKDENPPFYCWKCGDKLELGGFHEC